MSRAPARVLTAGETMALLDPLEDGPAVTGSRLRLRVAGAESNFRDRVGAAQETLEQVALVHLTAITMAISASARGLDVDVARRAPRARRRRLLRPRLPPSALERRRARGRGQSDVLLFVDFDGVPWLERVYQAGSLRDAYEMGAQADIHCYTPAEFERRLDQLKAVREAAEHGLELLPEPAARGAISPVTTGAFRLVAATRVSSGNRAAAR